MPLPVPVLIGGMFLTGCANSLLSKYQDKVCVENCTPGSEHPRVNFEQPVWQTLNMFAGEFLCVLPLLYKAYTAPARVARSAGPPQASIFSRVIARLPLGTRDAHYLGVSQEEVEGDDDDGDDEGAEAEEEGATRMRGWAVGWMWLPAFFDICGTTLMNVGLIFTPVSVFQMSRGALVLWVGVLSVLFLRRHLWLYQWLALVVVMAGVAVVGLAGTLVQGQAAPSGPHSPGGVDGLLGGGARARAWVNAAGEIATRSDDDPAKVALGVAFILVAQVFTATQYVVEEKIMSHYKIEPLAAVALEGLFGGLTTLLAMPVLHAAFAARSPFFDVPRGWREVTRTPAVAVSCGLIMLSIGSFNFFGLSVTSRVSATTRSTVDTCRTLGIWLVSLGIGWEALVWPFSLLQVTGFGLLVYGTFVFNGLVRPPAFAPPPAIHLPHEPALEETAEVPAAQGQGRAGYDIVPGADED